MVTLKAAEDLTSLISSPPALQGELALWEQLIFSFDMDNTPDEGRAKKPHESRSTSAGPSTQAHHTQTSGVSEYQHIF